MIKVRIPTPLHRLTNGQDVVEVEATNIISMIDALETKFPSIKNRLVDESGEIRRFLNVYIGKDDIRFLQNQNTPVVDGDEVSIIPAIAGG